MAESEVGECYHRSIGCELYDEKCQKKMSVYENVEFSHEFPFFGSIEFSRFSKQGKSVPTDRKKYDVSDGISEPAEHCHESYVEQSEGC